LHVPVQRVPVAALAGDARGEPSHVVRARVLRATAHRASRGAVAAERTLTADARRALADAATHLQLSARGWHRVVRVARTIADLDGRDVVSAESVLEAVAYRPAQEAGSAGAGRPATA
jgi:magnesium chelatase family protein